MSIKNKLVLAIPSKGRLKDDTINLFANAGLIIKKNGNERGYQGIIEGRNNVEVLFSSASEIAHQLKTGHVHLGVTGEDLVRETIYDTDKYVDLITELNFGHADVIIAVPDWWLDVREVRDLEQVFSQFFRTHGRRMKVATKYKMITRRFLAQHGINGYRIVESLGATEGAPASGAAEIIVDITSTGQTLRANHLKILSDGVMLKSQANLISSKTANWSDGLSEIHKKICDKILNAVPSQKETETA